MTPEAIGELSVVALDARDPRALAGFYSQMTGWEIDEDESEENWVELRADGLPKLAFQRAPDHRPPVWPGGDHPQQLHLDFDVADLDAAEVAVLAIGARKAEFQPGTTFRVFLDPAGHPFCLVLAKWAREPST